MHSSVILFELIAPFFARLQNASTRMGRFSSSLYLGFLLHFQLNFRALSILCTNFCFHGF